MDNHRIDHLDAAVRHALSCLAVEASAKGAARQLALSFRTVTVDQRIGVMSSQATVGDPHDTVLAVGDVVLAIPASKPDRR